MRPPLSPATLLASLGLAGPAAADVFQTPSGNVRCYGGGGVVDCEIVDSETAPPVPRPLDRDLDWGRRFSVAGAEERGLECVSPEGGGFLVSRRDQRLY